MKLPLLVLTVLLTQSSIPNRGVIRGDVAVFGSSEAIADAEITLRVAPTDYDTMIQSAKGIGPSFPVSSTTDKAGHFSIGNLLPGRYLLTIRREGFFGTSADGTGTPTDSSTIPVTIGPDRAPQTVSVPVIRGAVVTGNVYSSAGKPMSGARVSAFTMASLGALPVQLNAAVRATDDRGEFRLFWLKPGEYLIGVSPNLSAAGQLADLIARGPDQQQTTTYFPNTLEPELAIKVVVRAGDIIKGIDVAVQTADPKKPTRFVVSGLIVNGLPAVVPGTPVAPIASALTFLSRTAQPVAGNPAGAGVVLASPEGGEFELRDVPRGSYELYARISDPRGTTGGAGNSVAWGRAIVDVHDANVADIRVIVHASVEVKGRIRVEGVSQPAFKDARIWLEPEGTAVQIPNYLGVINRPQPFRPDGTFSIGAVAEGKYSVHVSGLADDFYLADIRQSSGSVQESGLEVKATVPETIELVLAKGAGTVEGIVSGPDGKQIPNAAVLLLPPPSSRQTAALVVSSTTDEQGHFVMRGVRPGEYTMIAARAITPADQRNSEYLQKAEPKGVAVKVTPSSILQFQLKLD